MSAAMKQQNDSDSYSSGSEYDGEDFSGEDDFSDISSGDSDDDN